VHRGVRLHTLSSNLSVGRQLRLRHIDLRRAKALILTGTPFKNRLNELFPLVNFLDPRSFSDINKFID
jgi:SNF2 family DNA or RNA helicase